MHKSFTGVTIKDADKGLITAVFSTFDVIDSDGDVVLPGAIKDGTEVVISAYGHESHWGALPVGKGVIRTTDTEAILHGQLFLDTTHGLDTFRTLKGLGDLGEWSYSLQDVTSHRGEKDGRPANFLEYIRKIKEVSPVLMGAGINTRTLAAKSGLKFSEEGEAVLADLDRFLDRAAEVKTLRAAKGRQLGAESTTVLTAAQKALTKLADLLHAEAPEAPDEPDIDDLKSIRAAHLRRDLFSNLTQGA